MNGSTGNTPEPRAKRARYRASQTKEATMKTILTTAGAALLMVTVAFPVQAAGKKDGAMAQREASCKEQAAQKYSAIQFLKRNAFVKECMGQVASKKPAAKKAKAS
jgi:hypothetical protein